MINVKNRGKLRMGKTRYLFKKIRDTKGTFHANLYIYKHTQISHIIYKHIQYNTIQP